MNKWMYSANFIWKEHYSSFLHEGIFNILRTFFTTANLFHKNLWKERKWPSMRQVFFAFLLVGKQINLRYEVFLKKLFCQRNTSSYLLRGWYMKMMIPFQPLHYLRPSVNPNLYKYYFTRNNGKLSSPSNNSYGENNDNRNSNPLLSNLSHYALLHIQILVSKC